MLISPRILRAEADSMPRARPVFTDREMERYGLILDAGQRFIIRHGRHALTLTHIGLALRMCRSTIRRYVIDLDELVYQLIARHLRAVSVALGKIPFDTPNRQAACRAAYIEATRAYGAPNPVHELMLRERHALPPDLIEAVEATRLSIAQCLCLAHPAAALDLLDSPNFQLPQIEAVIALLYPANLQPTSAEQPAPAQQTAPTQVAPTPPKPPSPTSDLIKQLGRFAPPIERLNLARAGPS